MLRVRKSRAMLVGVSIVVISIATIVLAKTQNVRDSLILFNEVMTLVREDYVDRVDFEKLIEGSIRGMLDTLDPHTTYLSKKQYDDLMVSTHGSFGGLGIEIDIRNEWLTVIAPIEGTPAHNMGIRGGDQIIAIEGVSTRGITITEAVSKLRGPKGTQVTITLRRAGEEEPMDYTITRDIIEIKSVPFASMLDDEIGYVRIAQFSEKTSKELRDALRDLRNDGMDKLIIDLRRNTGGLLTQAIEVSEQFLNPGEKIVSTRGRRSQQNREYSAGSRAQGGDYPLIVLVDHASASASEIVAGCIQDLDRGIVVGTTTFGKGTVQSVLRLPGGNALKITTAKYYTPSGRCINLDPEATEESAIIRDESAPDSGTVYHTEGGRVVLGGGGIRPDISVEPDTIPPIVSRVARAGLIFEYAVRYVADNEDIPENFGDDLGLMDGFEDFLAEKDFDFEEVEFEEGKDFMSIMLRSEIARKVFGDEAAYRISLERDSQLQKTVDIIRGSNTLSDLFVAAATEADSREDE
ncbi:MAG: S41 family peptidase [bacterium]|jgi:carboxyl-terminal processing protease